MDMSQYLEIFIEETKEHLQSLNQSLLQLEKDSSDNTMINEIFRVAHTIKGMAGTMGYNKMAQLTHNMEDVLHLLRTGEIKVNTKLIDLLFKCLDSLEKHINQIINTCGEGDADNLDLINELIDIKNNKSNQSEKVGLTKQSVENAPTPNKENEGGISTDTVAFECKTADFEIVEHEQKVINRAIREGSNAFKITFILNKGCLLKSARAFIIFQTLERHSEIIHSEPKIQDIEDERFEFEFTAVVISKETKESLVTYLNSISEIDQILINQLHQHEIVAEDASQINELKENIKIEEETRESSSESNETKTTTIVKPKTGKTVRVDIERLDVLMNLVSELIIIKNGLEGIGDGVDSQNYHESIEYLERITTSIHDAVMKVRMVPVETVFNRFPRMIRDISKDIGKEIELIMSGEETELDRTVIDEIGDPLIHLLRNSADHGIESPEARRKSGKSEIGTINLRAYQAGNNVIIEVEDDGSGIDVDRVKKKAIEKGLISSEIANNLSKKDIIECLFKPSFSTADKVSDLSGRGVGLDVVKTKIEALGGVVEVETEIGKGSKFIIRLPLTLAIIQALLVLIGDEKFAIPLNAIKEIINITPHDIKLVQKQEVILIRNTVIPIVRLDKILEVPNCNEDLKQLTVVIVKKGDKLSGFLVDSLIGQQEIVVKSLGKLLIGIKSIAGATILGDGNVALIVDINSLA